MTTEEIKQLDKTYAEGYNKAFPVPAKEEICRLKRKKVKDAIGNILVGILCILGLLFIIALAACGDS